MTLDEIKDYLVSLNLKPRVHFQLGHTMVFLRYPAFHTLRDELHRVVHRHVVIIQAQIRRWLARKVFIQQKEAAVKIQSFWRMIECQKEIEEWHLAAAVIQVIVLSWLF